MACPNNRVALISLEPPYRLLRGGEFKLFIAAGRERQLLPLRVGAAQAMRR